MIWFGTGSPKPIVFADRATLKSRHFSVEQLIVASVATKTYTLPTPIKDLAGKPTWFVNNSTGSQTLSGAFVGGSSATVLTKTMVCLMVLPVSPGVFKWFAFGVTSVVAGLQEVVEDYIGGLFAAGTDTGLTITYDDAGNAVNAAVAYGAVGDITDIGVNTTDKLVGSVSGKAANAGHKHALSAHVHEAAATGGTLALAAITGSVAWTTWSPTVVFSVASPSTTVVARYTRIHNTVKFLLDITTGDGLAAVLTSVTVPVAVKDINAYIPCVTSMLVGATYSQPIVEINALDNTEGNRIILCRTATVWTNANACRLSIRGEYEVAP